MYSTGYSQVKKYSPEAQKRMQYRSKGKSCGYYMRIVFFFSSLIQSLIIVSLVLFLVYGKKQDSASTGRIQDLENSFSRLSIENVALKQQRKNLTNLLNTTMTNKARNDWDLLKLRHFSNISLLIMQDFERKMQQCNSNLFLCKATQPGNCPPIQDCRINNCGLLAEQQNAKLQLVNSNFTQTVQRMRMDMDQIAKERDYINLEAIRLRRDKSTLERELDFYRQKSRNEFSQSLSGVSNVSKAFLQKIESLFPAHIAFQLTCPKQREHLEQIRSNCTSLSREVEDKLQRYLNIVGDQVSDIQAENNRLKAENWRLSDDYRLCSQNRSGLIQEHRRNLEKLQSKHDKDKEKLLTEKMKLVGEKEVLENSVKYKTKEVEHLTEQMKQLNISCISKTRTSTSSQTGWNLFGGGGGSSASSSSAGVGQLGRTGSTGLGSSLGSSGSAFNKPGSTGTGSSSSSFLSPGSNPSLTSSIGSAFNKPGSAGTGSSSSSSSSSSSFLSPGSSPNLSSSGGSFSSIGSAGSSPSLSSGGIGSNKPGLNTRGSSTTGSSSGSTGSSPNLSSSGIGSNKPASSVKSSTGFGSSTGSTGSTSKSGSTSSGLSWFGFGSSSSGQSKTGSGTGKDTSSGNSQGGTGSSFGTGRTNGLGGGAISVAQHIQELQRLINPSAPEEKQDLSRMLG